MTIAELKKQKIIVRKTDENKSTAYGMLINGAEQIAKREKREITDADIASAAKTLKNQIEADIAEYEAGNADTTLLKNELVVYLEFIPKGMSEAEVRAALASFVTTLSADENKKSNANKLKGKLKQSVPGIDMGLASKFLEEYLA